jgi:hypothetical protein
VPLGRKTDANPVVSPNTLPSSASPPICNTGWLTVEVPQILLETLIGGHVQELRSPVM